MTAVLNQLGHAFTPQGWHGPWLGHVLIGIILQAAIALPLQLLRRPGAWWLAACVNAGFWWGREKVEYEWTLKSAAGLRSLAPFWWRAWFPWDWGWPSAAEFLAPALAGFALAAFLSRRRVRA